MKVNKFNGHIFIFVSLATIFKSKMAAIVVMNPLYKSQLQVSTVGWNSCNICFKYFKYLKIYYIDG